MESALPLLQQVIGLEGPAPFKVRKKPVYPLSQSLDTRAISRILFPAYAARR
jgi:hypothetical protein